MACERWREMLSAQLDGEDDPVMRPLVDEHLAGCAGCRDWLDRAAAVNRLTRTHAVPAVPDLTDAILAALPPSTAPAHAASLDARSTGAGSPDSRSARAEFPGAGSADGRSSDGVPARRRLPVAALLYIALALVGTVQLMLGLTQVGGGVSAAHDHAGLNATPGHLWHESAAWNVAIGAGYLFIALRRTRPTGLLPTLTAFVAMLLLLSVNDLTGGRVDVARLVGHGFVILGYVLVVALARGVGGEARPPGARIGTGWRARFDPDTDTEPSTAPARPRLRLLPPPSGPLTARSTHQDEAA
ncbi:zf-HC2 domain-containing protein [Actinoplanes sp. NPDC023936]|uniref:zf-HC2 domain-containing protein n=1 Tax=Actinoplanes sp. NPDC023936 TaxID=3154910 RepID=UPI003402E013